MSKYFDCNRYPEEVTLDDGSFNYELVSHSLIAFVSDRSTGPDVMRKCYRAIESVMHANKEQLDGPPT